MQTRHECGVQGQLPPPNKGSPSATTSRRLMSRRFGWATSMPLDTCGQQHSPRQTHAFPELQTWWPQESSGRPHRQSRWVKERRLKRRKSKVRKKGGSMRVKNSGWWKMRHLHRNRLVTSASPSHCLTWLRATVRGTGVPPWTKPHASTRTWNTPAHCRRVHEEEA